MKHRARAGRRASGPTEPCELEIDVSGDRLVAHLRRPASPRATVICAHPGATAELAPAEHEVANTLAAAGFTTVLVGLATPGEDQDRVLVDVPRLAERLLCTTRTLASLGRSCTPLGFLGVGDAAAAALVATAMEPRRVRALVARSARPERAGMSLMLTRTPTLFIVGEDQAEERVATRVACQLASHARTEIIPAVRAEGLRPVVSLSTAWFSRWLSPVAANAWVDSLGAWSGRGGSVDHPSPIR